MLEYYQLPQDIVRALKKGNMPPLLKSLNKNKPVNQAGSYIALLNGACNHGGNQALQELLKIKRDYLYEPLSGVVRSYWGGKPYSTLMLLCVKHQHHDCLDTLLDYIRRFARCTEASILVTQSLGQCRVSKNTVAVEKLIAFERAVLNDHKADYWAKQIVDDQLQLWWERLEKSNLSHATQICKQLSPTIVSQLLVDHADERNTNKQVLKALLRKCSPTLVRKRMHRTHKDDTDKPWLEQQLAERENAVLRKHVRPQMNKAASARPKKI